ncbi:MAG: hypothetical protein RSD28_04295 [Lachnospiraceae bacterium]
MIEQEWMKFEITGCIDDYLQYRCHTNSVYGEATSSMTQRETKNRSVTEYGTDHNAHRHGVICSPGGRI